jgi:hypothetical protein
MGEISAARPWRLAVGLLLALALSTKLLDLLKLRGLVWPGLHGAAPPPEAWADPIFPSLGSALGLALLEAGLLVLEAGIVYLVGRGLGGRGPVSALLATQAFASLPTILPRVAAPAVLQDLSDPTGAEMVAFVLMNYGPEVWSLVLGVLGVRASLGLSTGRATASRLAGLACTLGLVTMTGTFLNALEAVVSWLPLLAPTGGGLPLVVVLGLIFVGLLAIVLLDRLHGTCTRAGPGRHPACSWRGSSSTE